MNHRKTKLLFLAAGSAAIVVVACSSSTTTTPPDDPEACAKMASACHPYDRETAIGKECHDIGHDGVLSKCTARVAECLAACPPREGGATHDAEADAVAEAASDSGADAAPDPACTTYCTCLADTCTTFAGYPFAAPGSCAAACAKHTADERKCWPKFCEDAKASTTNKQHLCEHAWGSLGLDECP